MYSETIHRKGKQWRTFSNIPLQRFRFFNEGKSIRFSEETNNWIKTKGSRR
jgi:hypothetical protein